MKKFRAWSDVLLFAGLAVMSFFAVASDSVTMPSYLEMLLLIIVVVLLASFMVFFWRERPRDEREALHQAQASRLAYITGSAVLIVALVIQYTRHELDPVIPLTILVMLATKLLFQQKKNGQ